MLLLQLDLALQLLRGLEEAGLRSGGDAAFLSAVMRLWVTLGIAGRTKDMMG